MHKPITPDVFWSKVAVAGANDCWPFQGYRNPGGYGRATAFGERLAHRVAYTIVRGPIPDGLFVLHGCDNRPCCNPMHLRAGTRAENMQDMVDRERYAKWDGGRQGEANPFSKLSDDIVRAIRASDAPHAMWARCLNVANSTISDIRNGKAWTHVQ